MNTTRRDFLGKMTGGTLALTLAGGIENDLFPAAPTLPNKFSYKEGMSNSNVRKFVPVMLTPFTPDLKIDFDGLSKLIDFYLLSGAKGFFANCASSEMYNLDNEERLELVRHVVKHVNGKVSVVATGSFGNTVEEQADFTKKMYDTGADAVILITSHFAKKQAPDEILIRNLEKYFSLTGNIPLGTYECPSPYKRILTPEVFRYLISTGRVVYHKDTCLDPEQIKVKLDLARNSALEFYDAHTPNTTLSLQMGAKGMSCIAGNFYPEIFAWMCAHALDPGRQQEVKLLQSDLTRADSIISDGYSLSAKYFLQKRGVPIEVNSRKSKIPLTSAQKSTLDNVYEHLLRWHARLGIVAER